MHTESEIAKQSKAKQSEAKRSKAKQSEAKRSKAKQSEAIRTRRSELKRTEDHAESERAVNLTLM